MVLGLVPQQTTDVVMDTIKLIGSQGVRLSLYDHMGEFKVQPVPVPHSHEKKRAEQPSPVEDRDLGWITVNITIIIIPLF